MTIVCKVELGLLKHSIMVIGEEGNILQQEQVNYVDISETAVRMAHAYGAEAIYITGNPFFKEELVQEISRLDSIITII